MAVLAGLPSTGPAERAAGGGRGTAAQTSVEADAVKGALERLVAAPGAEAAVTALSKICNDPMKGDEMRAEARALEAGPFGAEVAIILHQEKLDEPAPLVCAALVW